MKLYFLAIIFPFFTQASLATSKELPSTLAETIDQMFETWNSPQVPGCMLSVIYKGELLYSKGYGMADLESGTPIHSGTIFSIESMTKQFTAACLFLLEEQGLVSLDDPISRFFPEMPAYGQDIKVKHLLYHTSGIRDFFKLAHLSGYTDHDYYTEEEVMDMLSRQKTLNFSPGEEFMYNNSGYFLLAQIVRKVTDRSISEFAKEHIFIPLGMENTFFHGAHLMSSEDKAIGYMPHDSLGFITFMSPLTIVGDGGLNTTTDDLLKWDQNFYHNRLALKDFTKKMYTQGVLNNGNPIAYGAGLDIGIFRGWRTVSHSGSYMGFKSEMVRFPEHGLTVICLSNFGQFQPTKMALKTANLILEKYLKILPGQKIGGNTTFQEKKAIQLPDGFFNQLAGNYEMQNGAIIEVFQEKDKHYAHIVGQINLEIFPETQTHFFSRNDGIQLQFVCNEEGNTDFLWFVLGNRKIKAQKVQVLDAFSKDELKAYEGLYYNEDLNVMYRVAIDKEALVLQIGSKTQGVINLLSKDKALFADSLAHFRRNKRGDIFSFTLEAGEVKNLNFYKF